MTRSVAKAVAREAGRGGVAEALSDSQLEKALDAWMWDPAYPTIVAE